MWSLACTSLRKQDRTQRKSSSPIYFTLSVQKLLVSGRKSTYFESAIKFEISFVAGKFGSVQCNPKDIGGWLPKTFLMWGCVEK